MSFKVVGGCLKCHKKCWNIHNFSQKSLKITQKNMKNHENKKFEHFNSCYEAFVGFHDVSFHI